MDLDKKYELGDVVANDSESKTFKARELATGRPVFVHILFGTGAPGRESLLSQLLRRTVDPKADKRGQVLELSDHKGMPYAVTEVLPDFKSVRAWLESQPAPPAAAESSGDDAFARLFGAAAEPAAPPSKAAPKAPVPPAPPRRTGGEFTQLFRATVGDAPPAPKPPRPAAPPPPPPRTAAPPPPPSSTPGEFTRMFTSPVSPAVTQAPAAAPPPPPASSAPGEFTRLFHAPAASGSVPPPTAPAQDWGIGTKPPGSDQPGEFTRIFQSAEPAPQPSEPPKMPIAGAPAGAPGQFTQLFQSPESLGSSDFIPSPPPQPPRDVLSAPQPSVPVPPPPRPAGEFTRQFGASMLPGQALAPPPPPMPIQTHGATGAFSAPVQQAQPIQQSSGPGEYTRLFGAQPAVQPVQAPQMPGVPMPAPQMPGMQIPMQAPAVPAMQAPIPATQVPTPAAPKSSGLPLIILIVVMGLAMLGLILFLLLRK